MKRKIVYCTPSLYIAGGVERVLTLKANYFADVLGYDVYIILTDGKDKTPYYPLSSRIHVIQLDIDFEILWRYSFFRKIPVYLHKQHIYKKRLKKCLFQIKPDITVSLLRREINFLSSIRDGSKKIGELHVNRDNYRNFEGDNTHFIKNIFARFWMKSLITKLKRLDQFVVLSQEDKEKWTELKNVQAIPNPLPFYPDRNAGGSSCKAIAVGRYVYQKGFDLLIKAWEKVYEKHPDWVLNVYGNGDKTEYEKLIRERRLEKTCLLNDAVPDITEKYCESSVFILSSRFEGFGMVIAEAMACGVPAVSFACPCGPKDIIQDKEDGLLVENGNTSELAEKINYLIENAAERKEMGIKAKQHIERFKMENIAREWVMLFDKVLAEK